MISVHNEAFHNKTNFFLDGCIVHMKTLLLVDDDNAILKLCKLYLEQQEYTILIADSPDDAILISENHKGKIDMLITDIVMPVMNGLQLAKKLSITRPEMKCVFMSGCLPETIFKSKVFEKSINFIQKPFRLKDLAEKIRNLLDS